MRSTAKFLVVLGVLMGACTSAWADHHGHFGFGVTIGPYWGPWYYPPTYYYPPVVVEQQSPVYVQQQPVVEAAPPTNYWYYCRASNTYYPYAKECAAGWEKVPAKPAGQP